MTQKKEVKMKKFAIVFSGLLLAAMAKGQRINVGSDIPVGLEEKPRLICNGYSKSGDFYNSEFCLGSVNTGTFYAFMDWLKDKIHYPGMQAGILHDGELVWKGNWGVANIEENKPVNDSTVFRLLSVSKTFVGTAMMKLVEDGLIDLNGDINDYLPFDVINPFYPQSIATPKMVLSHTASVADYCAGSGPECNQEEYLGDPLVSLHDYMESHFVPGGICYDDMSYYNEPPGTYCYYSNPGAALGGYIVESVAGKGFNEYCNDSIFGLLNMPTSKMVLFRT
jgi:CubicO group peptidase (beta-lactamase class C family)